MRLGERKGKNGGWLGVGVVCCLFGLFYFKHLDISGFFMIFLGFPPFCLAMLLGFDVGWCFAWIYSRILPGPLGFSMLSLVMFQVFDAVYDAFRASVYRAGSAIAWRVCRLLRSLGEGNQVDNTTTKQTIRPKTWKTKQKTIESNKSNEPTNSPPFSISRRSGWHRWHLGLVSGAQQRAPTAGADFSGRGKRGKRGKRRKKKGGYSGFVGKILFMFFVCFYCVFFFLVFLWCFVVFLFVSLVFWVVF